MMVTSLLSLAAQHDPADEANRSTSARFCVLDGSPPDTPHAGYLARIADLVPHPVQVVGWRELPASSRNWPKGRPSAEEQRSRGPGCLPLHLRPAPLPRPAPARKTTSAFSAAARRSQAPPSSLPPSCAKEPAVGVHVLIWCDTLNNVTRAIDRQALRKFEMRVLFQMSATDSSTLIDTPVASKLGAHRALFHSEEEGRLEKFRPYGLPADAWLASFQQQMSKKRIVQSVRQKV